MDINKIVDKEKTKISFYKNINNIINVKFDDGEYQISERFQFVKIFNKKCKECKLFSICNLIIDSNKSKIISDNFNCKKYKIKANFNKATFEYSEIKNKQCKNIIFEEV